MRLHRTFTGAAKAQYARLFAFVISCALLIGCENSCIVIQSNPGGTIDTSATCQSKTGNIGITFSSSVGASQSPVVRPPRIFVTLQGIDAPETSPGDDAPVWQQLAPQLATKPVQIELTAPRGNPCAAGALGSAVVPAGVYRQLRLCLATKASVDRAAIATLPGESACGANVFSCIIPPDSAPQPLSWEEPAAIVIPSDGIEGGFIRVLPNSSTHLTIAFDPGSSRALPAGSALRLIPSFSAFTEPCQTGF